MQRFYVLLYLLCARIRADGGLVVWHRSSFAAVIIIIFEVANYGGNKRMYAQHAILVRLSASLFNEFSEL